MKLQDLLDLRRLHADEIEQRFNDIALLLFQEYHIQKGKKIYEFHEIEFYYYTKGHEDVITYPRNIDAGKWFFHASGVDLSFKSDSENYGGILIKSIQQGDKIINGPLRSSWILFDFFDAFEMKSNEYPLIVSKEKEEKIILKKKRKIRFNKDNEMDQSKAKKRFKEDYTHFIRFVEAEYQFYIQK